MGKQKEAKLNAAGVRTILRGGKGAEGVTTKLSRMGNAIAGAAGPGHSVRVRTGKNRVRVTVTTRTMSARRRQSKDRTLTRAIDAARQA